MTKAELSISPCVRCKTNTRHATLYTVTEREAEHDDYQFRRHHSIIECKGCGHRSFKLVFVDIQGAYPISDSEWETPEDIDYFPKYDPSLPALEDLYPVPKMVRDIYKESISAVTNNALTLAGLGLRGTIEAVCNDRSISGKNLEARISKLASSGLISSSDAERLHAIRFLGNDAAHDIKRPNEQQISVAVKIINHMLQSVYLLEREAEGMLDTLVTRPEVFRKLIDRNLEKFKIGDEIPLARILGRDLRRIGAGAQQLESYLVDEINAGNYNRLSVGKLEPFAGSNANVRHFIVKKSDTEAHEAIAF